MLHVIYILPFVRSGRQGHVCLHMFLLDWRPSICAVWWAGTYNYVCTCIFTYTYICHNYEVLYM